MKISSQSRLPLPRLLGVLAAVAAVSLAPPDALAAPGLGDLDLGHMLSNAASTLLGLISLPLFVGFALGYVANEAGRVAWTRSLYAWRSLLSFTVFAARYGVVAGLLGAALYFV